MGEPSTRRGWGSTLLKPIVLTRLMLFSARHLPDRTPLDVGLAYSDVEFVAADGVRLRGWFLPAGSDAGPAVVVVHGWLWNRLGNVAGCVPFTDRDVDFLPAAQALHDAGFHVLLMDLSNHGESDSRYPVTFGLREWQDVVAAVDFLRARADVDPDRIGVAGLLDGRQRGDLRRGRVRHRQGDPRGAARGGVALQQPASPGTSWGPRVR